MMKKSLTSALCLGVLALGGCSFNPATQSYVGAIPEANAALSNAVSLQIADYVASQLAPAQTTLYVAPAVDREQSSSITSDIETALKDKGFAISNQQTKTAHVVTYTITALDSPGVFVRLRVDGHEATSWLGKSKTGLWSSVGGFTVKEQ